MKQINMYEAKTSLSELVELALAGEEIVIARAGKALVTLTPVQAKPKVRAGGFLKGKIRMTEDFDAPLPDDILETFYGGPVFPDEDREG